MNLHPHTHIHRNYAVKTQYAHHHRSSYNQLTMATNMLFLFLPHTYIIISIMFKLGTSLNIMSKNPYDTNKFAMHKAQKIDVMLIHRYYIDLFIELDNSINYCNATLLFKILINHFSSPILICIAVCAWKIFQKLTSFLRPFVTNISFHYY